MHDLVPREVAASVRLVAFPPAEDPNPQSRQAHEKAAAGKRFEHSVHNPPRCSVTPKPKSYTGHKRKSMRLLRGVRTGGTVIRDVAS